MLKIALFHCFNKCKSSNPHIPFKLLISASYLVFNSVNSPPLWSFSFTPKCQNQHNKKPPHSERCFKITYSNWHLLPHCVFLCQRLVKRWIFSFKRNPTNQPTSILFITTMGLLATLIESKVSLFTAKSHGFYRVIFAVYLYF